MAAATTAVPATSQAAIVWSGNNGFVPITLPIGQSANVSFPSFGSVFAFSNQYRQQLVGFTQTGSYPNYGSQPIFGPGNSAVIQRLVNTASVVVQGNDPVRFAYSQFPELVDGGESGGIRWYNADSPTGTGQDIGGDSAGFWNGTDTETGYLLFRFDPNGGADSFLYGWFDIGYNNNTDDLIINGWAFDDSGAILGAGHLYGAEVPEASALVPAGLFALAAGAAGIRRRRSAQQKAAALAQK